jgi:hypothetical protein
MPDEMEQRLDEVARKTLAVYETPLARARLRAAYAGLTPRDELDGARETDLTIWFYRDGELVDSVEVAVDRVGLERPAVEEIDRRLRDEIAELVALHAPPLPAVHAPAPPAAPPPAGQAAPRWGPASWLYARRLRTLLTRILPVPAAAMGIGYLAVSLRIGASAAEVIGAPLFAFAVAYVAGFPTAVVASLVHTKLMRLLGRDSVRKSTVLGGVVGAVAGSMTPWFLPIVAPGFNVRDRLALVLLGSVVGTAYGWVVSRWHRLPPVDGAGLPHFDPPVM